MEKLLVHLIQPTLACLGISFPTVTTHNRTISSHINVHPGRKVQTKDGIIYSDAKGALNV